MQTQYFVVNRENPDPAVIAKAAAIIRQGGLVAFPTETVYGLGANGLDPKAAAGIYRAKGRPSDNPLILHISRPDQTADLAIRVTANAKALIERFWPGPLTVVLEKKPVVPDTVTGRLDTVAIRLPDSKVARQLISAAGVPVAAPSANTSGRPSPTTAQDVMADLAGRIDAVVDAGPCDIGLESTVVDCTTPVPTLLRPGGVTLEMLIDVLGEVETDPAVGRDPKGTPRSPGMKYTHYAPAAPMALVEGEAPEAVVRRLVDEVADALAAGKRVGAVVSAETAGRLPPETVVSVYGSRAKAAEIAANLYVCLRAFDSQPVDLIYAEGVAEAGIGLAVMNRLRKAAGYNIIKT